MGGQGSDKKKSTNRERIENVAREKGSQSAGGGVEDTCGRNTGVEGPREVARSGSMHNTRKLFSVKSEIHRGTTGRLDLNIKVSGYILSYIARSDVSEALLIPAIDASVMMLIMSLLRCD